MIPGIFSVNLNVKPIVVKPVEDMIKEADQRMYDDKAAIKEQFRKEGRFLHVRAMKPDSKK